jgi:predicted DNA-binding protein with PD1-like motif
MRYTRLGDSWILRLATGEEIVAAVAAFAADRKIDVGTVMGIGVAYGAVLGHFDRATWEYHRGTFPDEMEILSLSGNLAIKEGRPFPHLHATLGRRDFTTIGGHLFEAKAGATCELIIRPLAGYLQRVKNEATGLFLLDV